MELEIKSKKIDYHYSEFRMLLIAYICVYFMSPIFIFFIKSDKKSFIIRPENVNISYNKEDNEKVNNSREKGLISGEGKIIGKEYQGSLTSYEIEVTNELFRKKKLNAVMISGKKEYETGQTVKYSIDKSNLYEIES